MTAQDLRITVHLAVGKPRIGSGMSGGESGLGNASPGMEKLQTHGY